MPPNLNVKYINSRIYTLHTYALSVLVLVSIIVYTHTSPIHGPIIGMVLLAPSSEFKEKGHIDRREQELQNFYFELCIWNFRLKFSQTLN